MKADEEGGSARRRFDAIYQAHYGAISAYARRRTSAAADAQDAVAETFTIAWRRIDEAPAGDAALPWLYGVARRVLANQRRGDRRRLDLSARLRSQTTPGPDLEAGVVAADERAIVLVALARLRATDQELLRLAVWEELSHRDIAGVVGCSESSVAVRLHRARTRLGREIGKEERRVGQESSGRQPEGRER